MLMRTNRLSKWRSFCLIPVANGSLASIRNSDVTAESELRFTFKSAVILLYGYCDVTGQEKRVWAHIREIPVKCPRDALSCDVLLICYLSEEAGSLTFPFPVSVTESRGSRDGVWLCHGVGSTVGNGGRLRLSSLPGLWLQHTAGKKLLTSRHADVHARRAFRANCVRADEKFDPEGLWTSVNILLICSRWHVQYFLHFDSEQTCMYKLYFLVLYQCDAMKPMLNRKACVLQ